MKIDFFSFCILAPPKTTTLEVGWISTNFLNVTCQALGVYPEPQIRISVNSDHRYHPLVPTLRMLATYVCLSSIVLHFLDFWMTDQILWYGSKDHFSDPKV